jgi:hypothetical protein
MSEQIRALEVFDHVPEHCFLHVEKDDTHAPHIRAGEFVIIDEQDREPSRGDLFLLQWMNDTRGIMLASERPCQMNPLPAPKEPVWWLDPLNRFDPRRRLNYLSDGPYFLDQLRQKIVGRVIGLYQGPSLA